ncbi:MAG: two-component regulator propeller domain-containing protein [Vicinamibacteria bacterium]
MSLSGRMRRLAAAALPLLVSAASPSDAAAERLPVRRYTTSDGLAHDRIKCIVQDSRGFLWLCTPLGLSRFDGYAFTTYSVEHGLPVESVDRVVEETDGRYWIETHDGGLCRFEAATSRCTVHPLGDPAGVRLLGQDREGRVLAASGAEILRLEDGAFRRLAVLTGIGPTARVHAMEAGADGRLWLGTTGGLLELRPDGVVRAHAFGTAGTRPQVDALALDAAGRLWVASPEGLFVLRPPSSAQPSAALVLRDLDGALLATTETEPGQVFRVHGLPGADGVDIGDLRASSDGHVWIGTLGSGLTQFDGRHFRTHAPPLGVSHVAVRALGEDRQGNLWVGTEASGALKVSRGGFSTYDASDGLRGDRISSIFEDRSGRLVVATTDGYLNAFDGERFTAVRPRVPEAFAQLRGRIALQDRAGAWWIRSRQGLRRFAGPALADVARAPSAVFGAADGLAADNVGSLLEDSGGRLWVASATPSGAFVQTFDPRRRTARVEAEDAASGRAALPALMAEDPRGAVWVGFASGAVVRSDGRGVVPLAVDGDAPGAITALHFDAAGRLFVAHSGGPVLRSDDPGAARPRAEHTSFGRVANCITEDRQGRLYVGSLRGVERWDPATGRVKQFTSADGLAQNEMKTAWRDREGRLWFGTIQGLSSLDPRPDPPSVAPEVWVSSVRVAGAAHRISAVGETAVSGLELAPDRNQLQIEFVGLAFGSGESLRYQFRLDGDGRDWSAPLDGRAVHYAQLAPGDHRFEVRAVNTEGQASARPATVAFTVLAPFWRRGWFLAAVAVTVGALAWEWHRRRLAHLLEMERMRTRIASDLHDDIGSTLSQISVLGAVVQARVGDAPEASEPLSLIGRLARESMDGLSDIVWAINPRHDHLSNLAHRMRRLADDLLGAQGVPFDFSVTGADPDRALGAGVRRQVFLVFKEALNNVVRHAACTRVGIALRVDGGSLTLSVVDDGRGFDPATARAGEGLASLRQRAAALGGTLAVTADAGTSVVLTVPCG